MSEEEEKPKFDDTQINLKVKDQARANVARDSPPPLARAWLLHASRHTWALCRPGRAWWTCAECHSPACLACETGETEPAAPVRTALRFISR